MQVLKCDECGKGPAADTPKGPKCAVHIGAMLAAATGEVIPDAPPHPCSECGTQLRVFLPRCADYRACAARKRAGAELAVLRGATCRSGRARDERRRRRF